MLRPLLALSAALAAALFFACNTAEISEPPALDAGTLQCVTDVSVPQCDAGGVTQGCVGDPDAGFAAIRGVPSGTVIPYGCQVQRSEVDNQPVQCSIYSECRCHAAEAGASDGGADGGAATTGSWSCSTAR
jgi:hypothetical protein